MSEQAIASEGVPTPVDGENVSQQVAPPDGQPQPTGNEAASPPAAAGPGEPEHREGNEPRGVAKRIKELTDLRRAAEAREARLLALLEQQRIGPQPAQPSADEPEKGLADFGYDERKYAAYVTERTAKQSAATARAEFEKLAQERDAAARRAVFDARAQAFAGTVEDYDAVIQGQWACSQPMAEVIEESEEGPALAYYLAQNPDEASKLARMSAAKAGKELARIEDRLVSERKKAAEKAVSQAPPPPPKIEGANPGNVEQDPSKMTDAQFKKWREKHMSARR